MTTANPRHETLEGLLGLLADTGYTPGRPDHVSKAAADADEQAAYDFRCPACGTAGLAYKAFARGASYVALAYCVAADCDCAFEF